MNDEESQKISRLKDQVKLHYKSALFKNIQKQIMSALKRNRNQLDKTFIEATPKRLHKKLGGDQFRGSKYRGVSKNKSKWQVSSIITFNIIIIDDDHGQSE